jgi:hypothetical protein
LVLIDYVILVGIYSTKIDDPTENNGEEISIEELKVELSKREHIPNKIEAKIIRQGKALRGDE